MKSKKIVSETLLTRVEHLIERNNVIDLDYISQSKEFVEEFPNINNPYFHIKENKLNLLGLALWYNAVDCFKYIQTNLKASPDAMEKLLQEQKTSGIDIICQRGQEDMLDYYLPIYDSLIIDEPKIEEISVSLNLYQSSNDISKIITSTYTPIQKACDLGNLNILAHVYRYYKDKQAPFELDINYQDETSGENCALISCKVGNYSMIRYLYSTCHANFYIINKAGECAAQILAASNKKSSLSEFHECFVYLINIVKVDFTHNCEEILLLLDNEKAINFFEKKLRERGIDIEKSEIEDKNRLIKPQQVRSIQEARLDPYYGKDFDFKKLYVDIMKESEAEDISIISPESRRTTPFASLINDLSTSNF